MATFIKSIKSYFKHLFKEETKTENNPESNESDEQLSELTPPTFINEQLEGAVQFIRPSVFKQRPKTRKKPTFSPSISLWKAVQLNQIQLCKSLLKEAQQKNTGLNSNFKHGESHRTVLHTASLYGEFEICEILIDYAIDLKLNALDLEGFTPLHLACEEGHLKIVQLLVRSGADFNLKNIENNTPLHLASQNGREATVKWILTKMPDISIKNELGKTAEECSDESSIKELFEQFAQKHKRRLLSISKKTWTLSPKESETEIDIESFQTETMNSPRQSVENLDLEKTEEEFKAEDFLLIRKLGQGSFGRVYLVKEIRSQRLFAMKILKKQEIQKKNLIRYVMAERSILLHSNHPFIVSLYCSFETSEKLFLVMNYCAGGTLGSLIQERSRLEESEAKVYICEVLLAIEYLHHRNIIFRDLKPENIVLDENGHAMLADFGLSKEGVYENTSAHSFCGSIAYLPPEIVRRRGHGKAVDWYLLGGLLFEMLVGIPPYYSKDQDELIRNIQVSELVIPNEISFEARSLIERLLERDPKCRLGSNGDAKEVKAHPYFKGIDWKGVSRRELEPILPRVGSPLEESIDTEEVFGKFKSDPDSMIRGWSFFAES